MVEKIIGFAFCGSFCTFEKAFSALEAVSNLYTQVIPIFSVNSYHIDSRFGTAADHVRRAQAITGNAALHSIEAVEPIGPQKRLDLLAIAPCTGNTLAKLACGIADSPVTMAAKSHLRNGRPIVLAISTNDGLAGAAENIGKLLSRRNYYFVPFGQDDPVKKPASLVADFQKLPQTIALALEGKQLQPILTG